MNQPRGTNVVIVSNPSAKSHVGPIVMRPSFCVGTYVFKSASSKIKLFGATAQSNGLIAPGVLLTLSILSSKSVPEPDRGMKSFEKAISFVGTDGPMNTLVGSRIGCPAAFFTTFPFASYWTRCAQYAASGKPS